MSDGTAGGGAGSEIDLALVDRVARALEQGEVVLVPTDTVYGIAALPSVPGATGKLFDLKGRGPDAPLAVLVSDADAARRVASPVPPAVDRIMSRLWPGPLTIVVERDPELAHWELGGESSTIGVRCPDHTLVRAVAARVGPIATTSANRHGQPTPPDSATAVSSLDGPIAVVVDGGPLTAAASTVIDATRSHWHVIRAGPLSLDAIEAASRR